MGRFRFSPYLLAGATAIIISAGAPPVAAQRPAEYVALGDSYTAGPLIPVQIREVPGCLRSSRNYPRLVAKALRLRLQDMSCSGATTTDLLAPQRVSRGVNAPQLDALRSGTGLVTLGISGNDIGFSAITAACVSTTPLGRPCQDRFARPGGDEISRRIAVAGGRVAVILAEIRRRSPAARVFVVGYPSILPARGLGCWPVVPFASADVPYVRAKQQELNAMLSAQAAAGGARFVDTSTPSIGHDACALPLFKWVEPLVPTAPAAPIHPNARGMRGMAAAVVKSIGAAR